MFQPRQFLKRSSSPSSRATGTSAKATAPNKAAERHPAMRGLDVSPVHGRHCICGRCQQHHAG